MLTVQQILTLQIVVGTSFKKALQQLIYSNPPDVKDLTTLFSLAKDKISKTITLTSLEKAAKDAEKMAKTAGQQGIHILVPFSSHFPQALSKIDSPPVLLFVKGSLEALNIPLSITIVGTREPSPFGYDFAKKASYYFAQQNFSVVSGLALGCDTAAHQGCLEAGGKTIAVLAHGVDFIYPYQNKILAEQIVKQGGCLISEYLLGVKPQKHYFVERDRLESGLSQGLLVIESSKDGGTMHTARFAVQQKKLLACLKHPQPSLTDKSIDTTGNKQLLERGALSIQTVEDLPSFISLIKNTNTLLPEFIPQPSLAAQPIKSDNKRKFGQLSLLDPHPSPIDNKTGSAQGDPKRQTTLSHYFTAQPPKASNGEMKIKDPLTVSTHIPPLKPGT